MKRNFHNTVMKKLSHVDFVKTEEFSKRINEEILTLSTLEKSSVSKIKAVSSSAFRL